MMEADGTMTWAFWLGVWAFALALTAIIVGLAFWIGAWTFLVVFPAMILGGGVVVTRA